MRLHDFEFFRSQSARFFQDAVFDADFTDIMQLRRDSQDFQKFRVHPHLFRDHQRVFGNAVGMAARVRVFFVDGAGQHLD